MECSESGRIKELDVWAVCGGPLGVGVSRSLAEKLETEMQPTLFIRFHKCQWAALMNRGLAR